MRSRIRLVFILGIFLSGCTSNNITVVDSFEKYFESNNVTGAFGMFDNSKGEFYIYNLERYRDSSYLPASTFKIINSLIALETGIAPDEKMVIPWDGIVRPIENWNQDLDMEQAFKFSSVGYYQEIARRIGPDIMKKYIDSLSYGNKNIEGPIDSFWLNNTLKITSDEQLGMVKKLYFDQLAFQPRTHRVVKHMMLQEDDSNYKLSYKTGWGFNEEGHAIGWLVGWIEENRHPYFFVLNVESADKDADMTRIRAEILKNILSDLGFYKGMK